MANSKVFFDTNVLVYQFDRSASKKQQRAQALVEQYGFDGSAAISMQVVQEFINVALKKFADKPSPSELGLIIDDLLKPLCAHLPSFEFYERSLRLHATNSLSFYDALIVQAALDLGCRQLFSEDLQTGRRFGDLEIINPFV